MLFQYQVVVHSLRTLACACALASTHVAALTLPEAIELAQTLDPWLEQSERQQAQYEAEAIVAASLPNPMLSLGVANVPTDSFDFNQEPMTQMQLGVAQTLPRGGSRRLQSERQRSLADQSPLARAERRARVALEVSQLWLKLFLAQESVRLIESRRGLFEQLAAVVESSYTSALDRSRQSDLVRAQLELTRLEDRLTQLYQQRDRSRAALHAWLGQQPELPQQLAGVELICPVTSDMPTETNLSNLLLAHPELRQLDQQLQTATTDLELARAQRRPEWTVTAGYGYRQDAPGGSERSDFMSVGVRVDMPWLNRRAQSARERAAVSGRESIRSERVLALRDLKAAFNMQRANFLRLQQRDQIFKQRLLPALDDQAEAALTAYTRDVGDFAEAVRARIDQLNTRIKALQIQVALKQQRAHLNYFMAAAASQPTLCEGGVND